jgi:hypothetical protein
MNELDGGVPLLDDPVPRVRRNAAHALGCLTCKPAADAILPQAVLTKLAYLALSDPNSKVRQEAARAVKCQSGAVATARLGGSVVLPRDPALFDGCGRPQVEIEGSLRDDVACALRSQ